MRDLVKRIVPRVGRPAARVLKAIAQRIVPEESEFARIWPLIDSIEGLLVSPAQERWLYKTASSLPSESVIVEIGSFKGRSTCCLAYGCRGTNKHVFAIDTFDGNSVDFPHRGFFQEFWRNIETRGLAAYVTPVLGRSADVVKTWKRPIRLLFIDGSHQYEDVLADFENFFPHVEPGGVVAFHDVVDTWPGPLKVWREVASNVLCETGTCSTIAFGKKRPTPTVRC